jgi:hypothetical protein
MSDPNIMALGHIGEQLDELASTTLKLGWI